MQQLSATQSLHVFGGCGRLLHALNPTLQCLLVSIYTFWHGVIPTSYVIFILVYKVCMYMYAKLWYMSYTLGTLFCTYECLRIVYSLEEELYVGDLSNNIGLVLAYLLSGAMS